MVIVPSSSENKLTPLQMHDLEAVSRTLALCQKELWKRLNNLGGIAPSSRYKDEVSRRIDFIERELDVLESWLDYTGELEPPEPLARLPQLKHRIKPLLSQLSKVQQIALFSST
nr:PHD finger protein 20-like [Nothobranchius furzeri]